MIAREKIYELIAEELKEANEKYPLFHSPHEAYAVLKEEVEEAQYDMNRINDFMGGMWVNVRNDMCIEDGADSIYAHAVNCIRELIQVCAMCDKIKQSNLYEE